MQSQVHEIDAVTVELEVEVPWDRVEKTLNAGYGKLQKSAKVRGFRPGKVPLGVLKKLFGPKVNHEAITLLVEEGLIHAVTTHELALVATPEVGTMPSIEKGQPLAFKAKLEVRPKIDRVDTTGLELKRPMRSVSDADVDRQIEELRQQHAELETPEEARAARAHDVLTIDYVVEIDGEVKPDMAATGRTVELGADRLLPEFEEALNGKQVGDDVEIRIAYGEDTPNPDLKNKRALFKAKITELREKILPDLDDEFAKDVGEYESLTQLRDAKRKELEKAAAAQVDSALREQVVEQLVEKNPIPVPPSLIAQQEQAMKKEIAFYMQLAGGNLNLDPGDLSQQAEKKVRAAILMGAIARHQALKVEADEVEAKLKQIAEETGKHIAKVRVDYAGERRESLENKLLEDKLLEYLLSQATVTDAPADQVEETSKND